MRGGAWTFDGETVRIVPGRERSTHKLRQVLGEVQVPVAALAGIAYEPARKKGRLRLSLRDGADPLTQAARGQLEDAADPYQLTIDAGRTGAAQYFVEEVRNALVVEQVPRGPCDRYLMAGPRVPLTATAGDGTASFDGERVRLEWNWLVEETKKSAGPQEFRIGDIDTVEWRPCIGLENGYLRFRLKGAEHTTMKPEHDPYCLTWGIRAMGGTTVLLAAAVLARLPHPSVRMGTASALASGTGTAGGSGDGAGSAGGGDNPDVILRRLRELGELHRDGVLTDEEFAVAKQALLRRL